MDEPRRRRLALIWIAFALVMGYVTLSDGFAFGTSDLLGLVAVALSVGLAYLYYANPGGILDFGDVE
jgi:membrane-associated phospholipid phosphatase